MKTECLQENLVRTHTPFMKTTPAYLMISDVYEILEIAKYEKNINDALKFHTETGSHATCHSGNRRQKYNAMTHTGDNYKEYSRQCGEDYTKTWWEDCYDPEFQIMKSCCEYLQISSEEYQAVGIDEIQETTLESMRY